MSLWLLTIIVILIDQISKFFVVKFLYQGQLEIIPNIFSLTYVENTGTAWGLFAEYNGAIQVILPVVILGILILIFFTKEFDLNDDKFYKNIKFIDKPNSILVLVNKNNQLNSNFIPSDLESISLNFANADKYLKKEVVTLHYV